MSGPWGPVRDHLAQRLVFFDFLDQHGDRIDTRCRRCGGTRIGLHLCPALRGETN